MISFRNAPQIDDWQRGGGVGSQALYKQKPPLIIDYYDKGRQGMVSRVVTGSHEK